MTKETISKISLRKFKKGKYLPHRIYEPYTLLAPYYDDLMIYLDYKLWTKYINQVIDFFDITGKDLLEIAAGTGHLSELLSGNYNVTSMDNSDAMLDMLKLNYPCLNVIKENMITFNLKKKFDIIVSFNDNINYINKDTDILQHFISVKKHLKPNGIFLFDCTPAYNIEKNFINKVLIKKSQDMVIRWETRFVNNKTEIIATVDFYDKNSGQIFREEHHQRIYEPVEIIQYLKKAGFTKIYNYEGFTLYPPKEKSEHYHFAAF